MEDKHIIIILLVIFVVVAAAFGVMFLNQTNAKQPTKIKITSEKSQYEDDAKLSIQLTDLNKTPLSKEIVNISVSNAKGKVVVDDVVKTNSKGKAKLDLDLKKGKYTVKVAYGGNENYTGNNTTQKLTIKEEEVVEATVEYSSSDYSSSNVESDDSPYSNMPEETRKVYEARQLAADDGIPMYEYTSSPELVEKYQAMV